MLEMEKALRGMIELDRFRPRDGSVNEAWERRVLTAAYAALGERPPNLWSSRRPTTPARVPQARPFS